jgi:manganese efflux pump family protein
MDLISIIAVGIGLSMDALAVAVTSGFSVKKFRLHNALAMAFSFGFFQAIMPVIGWAAGMSVHSYIENFDHWVAFILLVIIGIKMIYESRTPDGEKTARQQIGFSELMVLSVATSIDALAVGISFSMLKIEIATPALIIGGITFTISLIGTQIGKTLGHLLENKLAVIGGLVLIIIGIKILLEHLL